jgi:hypothetical protein
LSTAGVLYGIGRITFFNDKKPGKSRGFIEAWGPAAIVGVVGGTGEWRVA